MKKICSFLVAASLLLTLTGGSRAESQTDETGVLRAGSIPAIGSFLKMGEQVQVTEKADDTHVYVKTERGLGIVETQLLRFPDEPFTPWQGTIRGGSEIYAHYSLLGEPSQTLKAAAQASVLEELEDCYYVSFGDEETGFVQKTAVIRSNGGGAGKQPATPETPTSPSPAAPGDGSDLVLMSDPHLSMLSQVEEIGPAAAKVDDVPVVLFQLQLGQEVTLLAEPELEKEGYCLISLEDGPAYVPQQWVRTPQQEQDEEQLRYAGGNCSLYASYLLMGKAEKTLRLNTKVTVYSEAEGVAYVCCGEDWGFVPSASLNQTARAATPAPSSPAPTAPAPTTPPSSSGGGGAEWSPPVL